jgi:hypothetical protein
MAVGERPRVLRIGDRVVFSGAEHAVVALSASSVRLLAASGETTVVAMPYLLAAPDFAVVRAGPRARLSPLGLLESLPAEVAEAARAWERQSDRGGSFWPDGGCSAKDRLCQVTAWGYPRRC